MREVIIDTNVFVSGIFWAGIPGKIVTAWTKGDLILAVNQSVLDEYIRVLHELTKKYKSIDIEPVINMLLLNSNLYQELKFTEPICRDKDDDKFIACAMMAGIDLIVSGDKDLLECHDLPRNIVIIKPSDFYKQYLS